jgi:hypothetical protein
MFRLGLALLAAVLLSMHYGWTPGEGVYTITKVALGWMLFAPVRRALWGSRAERADERE